MSPAAQSLLVFATVALAAAYLFARAWRKHRRAATGCGADDEGCGCTQLKRKLPRRAP